MARRRPELSPWQARYHPLGEDYVPAGTVLGQVQGKKHGTQTLPPLQGHLQNLAPHVLRERNERQWHQPRTQQASSNNTNGRPLRTAYFVPQYHPFGENHAKGAPIAEADNTRPRYAPRAQAETANPLTALQTPGNIQATSTAQYCVHTLHC